MTNSNTVNYYEENPYIVQTMKVSVINMRNRFQISAH